jgi:hypothetical protein
MSPPLRLRFGHRSPHPLTSPHALLTAHRPPAVEAIAIHRITSPSAPDSDTPAALLVAHQPPMAEAACRLATLLPATPDLLLRRRCPPSSTSPISNSAGRHRAPPPLGRPSSRQVVPHAQGSSGDDPSHSRVSVNIL